MTQALFICGIYMLGFCLALLLRKRIPFPFICLTGFIWGCTIYVVEGLVLLGLRIPYNLTSIAGLSAVVLVVLVMLNFKLGNWRLGRDDAVWLAGSFLVFFLGSIALTLFNFSAVSIDSFQQIMVGRELAFDGFSSDVINNLSLTGPFMLVLHSASVLIGSEYLYTLLPAFSLSLFMVFVYITYRSIIRKATGRFFALVLALLAALVLFSADFFLFQSFYIHTNLPAAVYLFVTIGVCWLAISEENNAWLAFVVPGLLSFSLLRTETFLYALFIIFLVISMFKLTARSRWQFSLPFLGLMLIWYIFFDVRLLRETTVLNQERVLLLIGLLVLCGIYVFILRFDRLEKLVRSSVVYVVAGGGVLVLAGMLVLETTNTTTSLWVTVQNMLAFGQWGAIWYLVFVGLILAFTQPGIQNEKFLGLLLAVYFIFLIALGSIRTLPYHLGRFDSGNRMLTHVLPLCVFYLVVKYAPAFMGRVASFQTWLIENKSSGFLTRP